MSTPYLTITQIAVRWSGEFALVQGSAPARDTAEYVRSLAKRWVVVSRYDGLYLYAFTFEEFLWLYETSQLINQGHYGASVEDALDIHEEQQSTKTTDRSAPPTIDREWRPGVQSPAIDRWVQTDAAGTPMAVGFPAPAPGPPPPIARPAGPTPRGASDGEPSAGMAMDAQIEKSVSAGPSEATPDEGTSPIRFPSIGADAALVPGAQARIRVELSRRKSTETQGGPVDIRSLPQDWKTVELKVTLASARIDFDADGTGLLTIERNAPGRAAIIKGTVHADLKPGDTVEVSASFQHGSRFCGSALRAFIVGLFKTSEPETEAGLGGGDGIQVDIAAKQPDVTVFIETIDKARSNLLRWRVEPRERFDGLPPQLRADIDLGNSPGETAFGLFSKFSALVPGKHRDSINSFGDKLWGLAPTMFHDAYWALVNHYPRRLTIQFSSDDPHLPWELMRPSTVDESTVHEPLVLQHTVARWIDQYRGDMRNSLPGGALVSIEPKYRSARLELASTPPEIEQRMTALGAHTIGGTRDAFLTLLREENPNPPVGLLHFMGHGVFDPKIASSSQIKLENGDVLTALEVNNKDVQLGRACRTLVFFNACEVGAMGSVFGEVGGWADAFLHRKFGAFIAPLWAVDESDARRVAADLLERVYAKREHIGEALREIRAANADKSSTFFAYLYYGDVTARLVAA